MKEPASNPPHRTRIAIFDSENSSDSTFDAAQDLHVESTSTHPEPATESVAQSIAQQLQSLTASSGLQSGTIHKWSRYCTITGSCAVTRLQSICRILLYCKLTDGFLCLIMFVFIGDIGICICLVGLQETGAQISPPEQRVQNWILRGR